MEISPLAKKLQLKPGHQLLLVNAPPGFAAQLAPLPDAAQLVAVGTGPADVVLCFAPTSGELAERAPGALVAVTPDGLLWFAYPKGSSGVPTDLNRDAGWEPVTAAGWEPVRQIAVDDTWSAVRFRRGAVRGTTDLLETHFAGVKAPLRPIFDALRTALQQLGPDVTEGARDSYIAYARRKQFAVIKTRARPVQLELGLRLPDAPASPRLLPVDKSFGSEAATHKVVLAAQESVDAEVLEWLRAAYAAVA
jgi:hypothetical protein